MKETEIGVRAKKTFPTVLLTLLSIVQALAVELLWSYLTEQNHLDALTWPAVLTWLQVTATLLGVFLIWLVYSDLVMRFLWVPTTTDAIFPFLIGILEFTLISQLGHETLGIWFMMMSASFLATTWISQATMKRARLDKDNEAFFKHVPPATWRDHLFSAIPVILLLGLGLVIWLLDDQGWFALASLVMVIGILCYQFRLNHIYTQRAYYRR